MRLFGLHRKRGIGEKEKEERVRKKKQIVGNKRDV